MNNCTDAARGASFGNSGYKTCDLPLKVAEKSRIDVINALEGHNIDKMWLKLRLIIKLLLQKFIWFLRNV